MRRLPKVAVVGLGGVGGAVAASLATAGTCELTCVTRGVGLATLRKYGLRLTQTFDGGSEVTCAPAAVEASPTDTSARTRREGRWLVR